MSRMFRTFRIAALTAALAGIALAATAQQAPTPLGAAVAATRAAKADYAFDWAMESSKQNWRARFDPRTTPKFRIVQPTREQLEASQRRAFDGMAEKMEGVSWCASDGMGRASNVRLLRDEGATAVYAFQPSRESQRGGAGAQFVERLRGEFTYLKADNDIGVIRMFITEPFSPIPLSRVDALEIVIRCETAPNRRRYAAETVMNLRVSALGQNVAERSVTRVSNVAAP